ncbi:MAG: hypothetical protein FWD41_02925, partial [Actinomycetia bacterium]|nr:hypothetical protein [Actinomycetes bacterium]
QLMLGIMTDNNFDIYSTSNKPTSIADARFSDTPTRVYTCKATSSAKRHYQGIGFLVGQLDDVYLMGFDTRGGAANEDWVDMYQLTADGKWLGGGVIEPIVTKHLIGGEGAHFKYGGNVEVVSDSEYLIYSIEQYYTGGGLRINMFSKR